jgi:hypothetical protein
VVRILPPQPAVSMASHMKVAHEGRSKRAVPRGFVDVSWSPCAEFGALQSRVAVLLIGLVPGRKIWSTVNHRRFLAEILLLLVTPVDPVACCSDSSLPSFRTCCLDCNGTFQAPFRPVVFGLDSCCYPRNAPVNLTSLRALRLPCAG